MKYAALLFLPTAVLLAAPVDRSKNPVELGAVAWHRDYAKARALAKRSDRDLFVLFQEVPG